MHNRKAQSGSNGPGGQLSGPGVTPTMQHPQGMASLPPRPHEYGHGAPMHHHGGHPMQPIGDGSGMYAQI